MAVLDADHGGQPLTQAIILTCALEYFCFFNHICEMTYRVQDGGEKVTRNQSEIAPVNCDSPLMSFVRISAAMFNGLPDTGCEIRNNVANNT